MIKKHYESKQEINTEIYLNKKNKKREYGKNRYHNMSTEKKQKLKQYQKATARLKYKKKLFWLFFLFIV